MLKGLNLYSCSAFSLSISIWTLSFVVSSLKSASRYAFYLFSLASISTIIWFFESFKPVVFCCSLSSLLHSSVCTYHIFLEAVPFLGICRHPFFFCSSTFFLWFYLSPCIPNAFPCLLFSSVRSRIYDTIYSCWIWFIVFRMCCYWIIITVFFFISFHVVSNSICSGPSVSLSFSSYLTPILSGCERYWYWHHDAFLIYRFHEFWKRSPTRIK